MNWINQILNKGIPIVALAPMDGYTDSAFRAICHRVAPDIVVYSEFFSADGLYHNSTLAKKVLTHDPIEHPLVFQIFGNTPEMFLHAGKLIESYGAQGIDINMGCPAKKIVKCGYGSGLMIDLDRAMRIVNILAENLGIPVSVKTRLGWSDASGLIEFGKAIENAGASLITVHGRTFEQEYAGTANWEPIFELQRNLKIPVLGNGDVKNYDDGLQKIHDNTIIRGEKVPDRIIGLSDYQGDSLAGFMIGRSSLGNPWCFLPGNYEPTWTERIAIMREHMIRMVSSKGENRACLEIRKHFTHYLHGFDNASLYRKKLATVTSQEEANQILDELLITDKGL